MATRRLTQGYIDKLKPASRSFEVRDTTVQNFLIKISSGGQRSYYVVYARPGNGKKRRYRIGDASVPLEDARARAQEILGDVARGIDPMEQKKRNRVSTLEEFLSVDEDNTGPYVEWARARLKSGTRTISRLRTAFKPLLKHRLNEIDHWTLKKWESARRKEKVGRKSEVPRPINIETVRRDIATLKGAMSKAYEWGMVDANRLRGYKLPQAHKNDEGGATPKREQRKRYLTPDEETALFKALDARSAKMRAKRISGNIWMLDRGMVARLDFRQVCYVDHLQPMIEISLDTGLRRGELFQLTWADVDFDQRHIRVRSVTSKTSRTRHVPMTERVFRCMTAWRDQNPGGNGLVFLNPMTGKEFDNVNTAWAAILKAAKIEGFRWHDMRHTFASRLVDRGVALYVVKELLGHSTIAMTERYSHVSDEHKVAAVRRLDSNILDFEKAESETGGGD